MVADAGSAGAVEVGVHASTRLESRGESSHSKPTGAIAISVHLWLLKQRFRFAARRSVASASSVVSSPGVVQYEVESPGNWSIHQSVELVDESVTVPIVR